jgi:hypothetical protein
MRRASIAAVARHDAFGYVLTVVLSADPLAGLQPRRWPGEPHWSSCALWDDGPVRAALFLVLGISCHPLKTSGGGRAGRGYVILLPKRFRTILVFLETQKISCS